MSTARRVLKNTTVLLAGNILSTGLGVVYVSALARYIHAAGMGKLATATSLVAMLGLVVDFGVSQVVTRDIAADRAVASIYVPNVLLLRVLLSFLFVAAIVGVTDAREYPVNTALIIYIYGLAYIFDQLADVLFSVFNGFERMEFPAILQTGRNLINIGLSLGAIYSRGSLVTIVMISAVASFIKLAASLVVLRRGFVKPKLKIDLALSRRILGLSLPFAGLTVVSVVNRQVDTYLLSLYRSETEVGWFSSANMLITYMLLVPSMLNQSIFPVFARFHSYSKESLEQGYRLSFRYLLMLGVPLCVGTIVTADRWIALLYGPGFENAAVALRILSFILFWMFGFANGALLNATGGEVFLVRIAWIGVALNVVVALLLIPDFGFVGASVAGIVGGAVFLYPVTAACHKRLAMGMPYSLAVKSLISAGVMGVIVAFSLRGGLNLFVSVFAVAPIVYGLLLVAFRVISDEDRVVVTAVMRRGTATAQLGETASRG